VFGRSLNCPPLDGEHKLPDARRTTKRQGFRQDDVILQPCAFDRLPSSGASLGRE
jgi:hypothetical protein